MFDSWNMPMFVTGVSNLPGTRLSVIVKAEDTTGGIPIDPRIFLFIASPKNTGASVCNH